MTASLILIVIIAIIVPVYILFIFRDVLFALRYLFFARDYKQGDYIKLKNGKMGIVEGIFPSRFAWDLLYGSWYQPEVYDKRIPLTYISRKHMGYSFTYDVRILSFTEDTPKNNKHSFTFGAEKDEIKKCF